MTMTLICNGYTLHCIIHYCISSLLFLSFLYPFPVQLSACLCNIVSRPVKKAHPVCLEKNDIAKGKRLVYRQGNKTDYYEDAVIDNHDKAANYFDALIKRYIDISFQPTLHPIVLAPYRPQGSHRVIYHQ